MQSTGRVIQYSADRNLVDSFSTPGWLVRAWFTNGDFTLRVGKEEVLSAKEAEAIALQRIRRADHSHRYGTLVKVVSVKDTEENRALLVKGEHYDEQSG